MRGGTMMILPIKRKWLEAIRTGEKTEEYRSISPYYAARFKRYIGLEFSRLREETVEQTIRGATSKGKEIRVIQSDEISTGPGAVFEGIVLRAGYSLSSPAIEIGGHITIGTGRPEWGAEPGVEYYVLSIETVTDLITDSKSESYIQKA